MFGDDLDKMLPVIREGGSDTAIFDNVLEFLVMAGRSLPHAILMMIPEPWQNHETMSPDAARVLRVPLVAHGAVGRPRVHRLHRRHGDRRRARPQRAAALALLRDQGRSGRSWRPRSACSTFRPRTSWSRNGSTRGRSSSSTRRRAASSTDEEIKERWRPSIPYAEWLQENLVASKICRDAPFLPPPDHETVLRRQQAFGYTQEDLRLLLAPMATNGEEPIGSMGTDTPLAVLSDRPRLLYDYFKQLFAQVTNPPLDAIREELVTSMESTIGPERNLLKPEPESCRQINVRDPVIGNDELARLRHIQDHAPSTGSGR